MCAPTKRRAWQKRTHTHQIINRLCKHARYNRHSRCCVSMLAKTNTAENDDTSAELGNIATSTLTTAPLHKARQGMNS